MKYTICQGCPASGKSYWVGRLNNKFVEVNRDNTRRELFNFGQWSEYKFTKAKENQVTDHLNKVILDAASKGLDVVDSNTNLNPSYLIKTMAYAQGLGYEVEFKTFFDVPLHVLIKRNIEREYSVGEDVIHRMFRAQLELQDRVVKYNPNLPDCIVCDVDGTVAEMGKGEKWGRYPYDWDKVLNDRPKVNVIGMINKVSLPVIFLTGRDGCCINDTRKWLERHIVKPFELYSREADNMEPDCDIKERLLKQHVLPRYNVSFCIDDRNQMVDHYRALGLECWQVAAGRF